MMKARQATLSNCILLFRLTQSLCDQSGGGSTLGTSPTQFMKEYRLITDTPVSEVPAYIYNRCLVEGPSFKHPA